MQQKRQLTAVIVAAGLLPGAGSAGAEEPYTPLLISTDWVAEHLDDRDVVLVHVAMAHHGAPEQLVPGAALLDYHAIETSEELPIEMPPVARLQAAFRGAGISNESHVVLYGPAPAHLAARAFVTLEYLGHERVSVMDGGIEAWVDEGRPVTDQPISPGDGSFDARADRSILVDAAWIRERLEDPKIALIDARPPDQFEGQSPSSRLRPGHIPGAGNLYYADLLRSEKVHRLKDDAEARRLLERAGAAPGETIVSYCQIGMRASYNYLVARHLGYDVKFYDPSWAEWGADGKLPAETGPPR